MKVAQLMATIPDLLPPEYAAELQKLQSEAPPMGWAFVKRRMIAELGPDWQKQIRELRASSGRRRFARPGASRPLARRRGAGLQAAISRHAVGGRSRPAAIAMAARHPPPARSARSTPARSARRSASACAKNSTTGAKPSTSRFTARCSTASISSACRAPGRNFPPAAAHARLARRHRMLAHKNDPLDVRNALATAMFTAWWFPFSRFGVIHGDPHLGNYTVFDARRAAQDRTAASTCSTTAASAFSRRNSCAAWSISITGCCMATTIWSCTRTRPGASASCPANSSTRSTSGRASSTRRCSTIACAPSPTAWRRREYGRREAFRVHQALKQKGPVTVPREFVFMDRAAIGLGAVFLHLRAELNFYRLFNEAIEHFSHGSRRQAPTSGAGRGGLVGGIDGEYLGA